MYIETVECSHNEFGRRRFLLGDGADLKSIMGTSAQFAVINSSRSKVPCDHLAAHHVFSSGKPADGRDERRYAAVAETVSETATALRGGLQGLEKGDCEIGSLLPVAESVSRKLGSSLDVLHDVTRLRSQDEATYIHSIAVSALMSRLALSLDMDEEMRTELTLAGLLHDIGKLLIPLEVLNKPDRLTEAERDSIRAHPELGYQLLKEREGASAMVLDVCRLHHELLDGSGYPLGLKGDALSLAVRISTVCDVFDALTSVRPYKRAWTPGEALTWMFARGHLFDRKLVLRLGSLIG